MAQTIKHLIVLMLENRSFDHMLGFTRTRDYPVDGLTGDESCPRSASDRTPIAVARDGAAGLPYDAGHSVPATNLQLFFNHGGPPVTPGEAGNSGFVLSYAEQQHVTAASAPRIMSCFTPADVPALSGLAREYAVCDRWFSSVPGPTWPNRFFVHAATSKGVVTNDATVNFDMPTIFESLSDASLTWRVYSHDFPLAQIFGRLTQPEFDDNWDSIGGFKRDCRDGTLPHYAFIEPKYIKVFGPGNSQHPPEDIGPGDQLIDEVYHAVRTSPSWNDTMLVVTYDEHGGTYDHVMPPENAVAPDNRTERFSFTRLGVRVPAVIVSPWVKRGTIVHDLVFDHSSVPATVKKIFGLPHFLTRRDAAANTFEAVASLPAPRTDTPLRFRAADGRALTDWGDEVATEHDARMLMATGEASAAPISDLQLSIVELARELTIDPGDRDARALDLVRPMITEHDAAVYVREAAAKIRAALKAGSPPRRGARIEPGAHDAVATATAKLHVTQDDHGYWMLSLEAPDGTLALVAHQFETSYKPLEIANEMVREGTVRATIIVDPPRTGISTTEALPGAYRKPAPRKAGA